MKTSTIPGGDTPNESGGPEAQNQVTPEPKPNVVSHETYSKVLDEAKSAKARLAVFEAKEKEAKEKSGEFESLFREAQAKLEEEAEKRREETARFALSSVTSQLRAEASKRGVTRLDVLEKLVDIKALAKETDSNFQVKPEALNALLEKTQKENDFLFKKEAAGFRDAAPTGGKPVTPPSAAEELRKAKNQMEFDKIARKHGLK